MPKVFISHSTSDREFVENNIIAPLQRHAIDTWYCKDDIYSAADWDRLIRAGLDACDWFLVVISDYAITSDWVKAEVHWAFKNRKNRIIPVLIADCEPSDLHLQLVQLQYVDFRHDAEGGRAQLLACWGIDESDPNTSLDAKGFFDKLRGPTTEQTMLSLQRRAAKLSGETQLIGASTMVFSDNPTDKLYLFMSSILYKTYYVYMISSSGEELAKLNTNKFPPPNEGDQTVKMWSTRSDKALDAVVFTVKSLCPFNDFELALKYYECDEFFEGEKYLLRRNYFNSNYGDVEVGTKREHTGDTSGCVFFQALGKAIQFVSDKNTHEIVVVGQSDRRPF